jgi:aldose 1-epimerase
MDFRKGQLIARSINDQSNPYTEATGGLDHCFVTPPNSEIVLGSPLTGCRMTVTSDQPAFQVYTGNALDQTPGKYRHQYGKHSGICLEAQLYPDSPNHPHFPNCFLKPEERYEQQTAFHFDFIDDEQSTDQLLRDIRMASS